MNIFDEQELKRATASAPDSAASEETELQAVLEILRHIIDPELGINVVDLGLVYKLENSPGGIRVEMTMTTPGCPMHESIIGAAERALRAYFATRSIDVQLVWEPPWTTARMTQAGRAQLAARY